MRRVLTCFVLALALVTPAAAHVPGTAIGQAVLALRDVPVSYENGAAVSDLEADSFGRLPGVGDGIYVAAMPASALQERLGGPDGVAEEIAREARLHGTLVVLTGTKLGAWSDGIEPLRLERLVAAAMRRPGGPTARVAALVASVDAEPMTASGGGLPWSALLVAIGAVVAVAGVIVVFARRRRMTRAAGSSP
jgi:hypothetical protein